MSSLSSRTVHFAVALAAHRRASFAKVLITAAAAEKSQSRQKTPSVIETDKSKMPAFAQNVVATVK
jgi:nucleoid-associated protein YgaU